MRITIAMLSAALALAAPALMADEPVGQIKTAKGVVIIVRDGVELRNLAGAPVYETDRVVTLDDSSVGITFNDDSMLSLGPNSELDLSAFSYGDNAGHDEMEATLNRGTLAAISGKITERSPGAMKVRTPTTILGVRGTEFYVQVAQP